MAHVFLSYKSTDKERVRPLVALLESRGWKVWWDRRIPPGKTFDEVIEEAIKSAACVVVVWSHDSVQSRWVKNEAAEGARRDILVPVLIDDIEPPFEFRRIQAAKVTDLANATADDPEVRNLLSSVADILQGSGRVDRTQSQTMKAVRLEKREGGEGRPEPAAAAAGVDAEGKAAPTLRWPHRRFAVALGATLAVGLVAFVTARFLLEPGPPPGPPPTGTVSFIGVDAGPEYAQADDKLLTYLKGAISTAQPLRIGQEQFGYEAVAYKLAGWNPADGPFLARTTPYVYVAAMLLGADLEVLATYHSRATGGTTYRSYFVVAREDFPNGPPTLDELVPFLKRQRRSFVYHSRFSTSSYLLPSLFLRGHKLLNMERSTGPLFALDAREVTVPSSTDLVRLVARGEADVAAVWDGTRAKFEPGNPAFKPDNGGVAERVYFVPLDTALPNDLLVCSTSLPEELKQGIRDAVQAMQGRALIDVDDFLWWEDFRQAPQARQALAALQVLATSAAVAAPAPVTVEVGQDDDPRRQVPPSYLEAARRAIRQSGTEFTVYDPEYHSRADFIWKLALDHDGAVLLTSRVKGLSDDAENANAVRPQRFWISFADEAELTGRISSFIHSRIYRVRYLWPYAAEVPTVIRDVGFSLAPGTRIVTQQVVWKDPERDLFTQGETLDARIAAFDAHKITLDLKDLSASDGGFKIDPLSNRSYRVILARESRQSAVLVALSYSLVALLLLAAAGTVWDFRRSRRRPAAAKAVPELRLVAPAPALRAEVG